MSFSFSAAAVRVDCGYSTVKLFYVIGSRFDGNANNNRLLVSLPERCSATAPLDFVRNDDPSYEGILSMLLAAKMSDKQIRFVVNDSISTHNSVKIEWVNFK